MRNGTVFGVLVAGVLLLGWTGTADAQFSLSIGNPYPGSIGYGVPNAGYGAIGGLYGTGMYGTGMYGYGGGLTGTSYYSSGYYGSRPGLATFAYPRTYNSYYGYAPYYGPGYARYGYGLGYGRRGILGGRFGGGWR